MGDAAGVGEGELERRGAVDGVAVAHRGGRRRQPASQEPCFRTRTAQAEYPFQGDGLHGLTRGQERQLSR